MKKIIAIESLLILGLIIFSVWLWNDTNELKKSIENLKKPNLYSVMSNMQVQVHKLSYGIKNQNLGLINFYMHELEEGAEDLIKADLVYHDQPVGQLTETMLIPVLHELEVAIEKKDWDLIRNRASALVLSCNNCHNATGYSSIHITEKSDSNPFNQRFSVEE